MLSIAGAKMPDQNEGRKKEMKNEQRTLENQPEESEIMGNQSDGPTDRKKKKRRASSSSEGTEIKLETFSLF